MCGSLLLGTRQGRREQPLAGDRRESAFVPFELVMVVLVLLLLMVVVVVVTVKYFGHVVAEVVLYFRSLVVTSVRR